MSLTPRDIPGGAQRGPQRRLPPLLALLGVVGLATVTLLLWNASQPDATRPSPTEIPGLVDPGEAPPPAAGSLQALVPGIPPDLRLVVPGALGAAELWDWPTASTAPVPNAAVQQPGGWLTLHSGGLWAAEVDFTGALSIGTVFNRVFHAPAVHSMVWHVGAEPRLAWLTEPPDGTAELWTASLSRFSVDSRRVASVPQIEFGSPDIGDAGFLVAFGDWGYVIERALPTTADDVAFPLSQLMAIDAAGVAGPWRDGRLIAAAPDGRLLVGLVDGLSGAYRLEMTRPDLLGGRPLSWVSIGHTSWSPTGTRLFNMIDLAPPTARFSITSDGEVQRHHFDAQSVQPLGWSADGGYFLLGAILPAGRQLVIVDVANGSLVMTPVDRIPRNFGLG